MKRKKLLVGVLAVAILVPSFSFAAYNDVSLTTNARVVVSGETLSVSGSTAIIDSIISSADNVSVTLGNGSSVTFSSPNRRVFSTNTTNAQTSKTCTSSESTLTITSNATDNQQVNVSVNTSDTCAGTSSTSSGSTGGSGGISGSYGSTGGGGGGGGGGGSAAAQVATAASPSVPATSPAQVSATTVLFSRALSSGSQGDDVKTLQTLLSLDKAVYPEGKITGYFGPATARAIGRFQEKYGLAKKGESGYGRFGPKTTAKLVEVSKIAPAPASTVFPSPATVPAPAVAVSGSTVFNVPIKVGSRGDSVKKLQEFLNRDLTTRIAETGPGSLGNETTFYGNATKNAVGRFQEKYDIAKSGDAGYGYVGPKTRAKLNELMASGN